MIVVLGPVPFGKALEEGDCGVVYEESDSLSVLESIIPGRAEIV